MNLKDNNIVILIRKGLDEYSEIKFIGFDLDRALQLLRQYGPNHHLEIGRDTSTYILGYTVKTSRNKVGFHRTLTHGFSLYPSIDDDLKSGLAQFIGKKFKISVKEVG